jgi:orotate phosphoribosyltransferase
MSAIDTGRVGMTRLNGPTDERSDVPGGSAVPLSILRDQVVEIVRSKGLQSFKEPLQLASGEWSHDFIDGKRALADGRDLELACRAMIEFVKRQGVEWDAVGGLTLGADQFSHGVALLAGKSWFVVRKQPKGRGTNKRIEGAEIGRGTRVLLVDDVVTTGGSIQEAYSEVILTGADVVGATTLVDRGATAAKFFADEGVPYEPLVTYGDLGIAPVGLVAA